VFGSYKSEKLGRRTAAGQQRSRRRGYEEDPSKPKKKCGFKSHQPGCFAVWETPNERVPRSIAGLFFHGILAVPSAPLACFRGGLVGVECEKRRIFAKLRQSQ